MDQPTPDPDPENLTEHLDTTTTLAEPMAVIATRVLSAAIGRDMATTVPAAIRANILKGVTAVIHQAMTDLQRGTEYDRSVMTVFALLTAENPDAANIAEALGDCTSVETHLKRCGLWPPAIGTDLFADSFDELDDKGVHDVLMAVPVVEVPDVYSADPTAVDVVSHFAYAGNIVEVGESWVRPGDALNLGESVLIAAVVALDARTVADADQ